MLLNIDQDYWYYACKHHLELHGHKCTYKKQIHQDKSNDAVAEVINHIVKNSKFDKAIREKLESCVGLENYINEEEFLTNKIKQLSMEKERLGMQLDQLDYTDKHYDEKYNDMSNRLEALNGDISEVSEEF